MSTRSCDVPRKCSLRQDLVEAGLTRIDHLAIARADVFSLDHLRTLRLAEIEAVAQSLPPRCRVLEIGAGTGEQAAQLARRGFDVAAIDLITSKYRARRAFNIADYDGINLPFPDQSFDAVFSSNVLEHVTELDRLEQEIRRVLRPGGKCIHLLPTPAWRLWSAATVFVAAGQAGLCLPLVAFGLVDSEGHTYAERVLRAAKRFAGLAYECIAQSQHGERGNRITEYYYFSRAWWTSHFESSGFRIVEARPAGLFYTGFMALGPLLPIAARRRLAPWLGSACHWYELAAADEGSGSGQAHIATARSEIIGKKKIMAKRSRAPRSA